MNLRQALTALPFYFLEDVIQELIGKVSVNNRSAQVRMISEVLERRETLKALWERLEPAEQAAVQLALYNDGKLDLGTYEALYGELPVKPFSGLFGHRRKPQYLKLFFLTGGELPEEMIPLLKEWVERPPDFQPRTLRSLPDRLQINQGEVELMVVETERAAWHDLVCVLRESQNGRLKTSETSLLPAASALRVLQKELTLLDYYEIGEGRAADTIRPCGLVAALQAGGLAETVNGSLRPSEAGLAWLKAPSAAGLREAFLNWIRSGQLDELRRISALKGQQPDGAGLSRPELRRRAILSAINQFKPGEWIAIEEFFKTIKLSGISFEIEASQYTTLQVSGFGLLDNASRHTYWQAVNGQYILAVVMEFLASFGAVDLAYTEAKKSGYTLGNLEDYITRPLSRYDGLKYFRLTPLGAYLLGQDKEYLLSSAAELEPLLEYAENLQLVLRRASALNPNDRILLERFCARQGETLYRLDPQRTVEAFEEGYKLDDVLGFLERKTLRQAPGEVQAFFERLRKRSGVLARKGEAVLYQVKDLMIMKSLLSDEVLGELCVLAEDHQVVVQAKDEVAFRRRLRELEAGVKS
jgi:hypothetical protein